MKAINILEQASLIVSGSSADENLKKSGVGLINTILEDLSISPITALTDDIAIRETGILSALINGVGMLICLILGDDSGLSSMSEIYNSKRSQLRGNITKVRETIFGGGEA